MTSPPYLLHAEGTPTWWAFSCAPLLFSSQIPRSLRLFTCLGVPTPPRFFTWEAEPAVPASLVLSAGPLLVGAEGRGCWEDTCLNAPGAEQKKFKEWECRCEFRKV